VKKPATLIHVNQHVLRANVKAGVDEPMLTCKQARSNTYAHEALIRGPSRFVNGMHKPLSCGARVWLRTEAEVEFRVFPAPAPVRSPARDVTIIRVNPVAIRNNVKNGSNEPALSFMRGGVEVTAHEVIIHGPATVRTANLALEYEGRIWVETSAAIECVEIAAAPATDYALCALPS
jgi:hypothetical protein